MPDFRSFIQSTEQALIIGKTCEGGEAGSK
jgi:hypothetical protein